MAKPKPYLTKSRYKIGHECPTKLYYQANPEVYANQKLEDPFLKALAESGHQVGALAKLYFPGGIEIETLDYAESLKQTQELLTRDRVIIFEAALRFEDLFIRVDVLVKRGSLIELYEVKATSYQDGESFVQSRTPFIYSDWAPYLFDVAFQTYVVGHCLPQFSVEPYLFVVNKEAKCPTDSLHQKFEIVRTGSRGVEVHVKGFTDEDIQQKLLIAVPVKEEVELILKGEGTAEQNKTPLEVEIQKLAKAYTQGIKLPTPLSKACAECEFYTKPDDQAAGKRSGLDECWREQAHLSDQELLEPKCIDLWDYRRKPEAIAEGKFLLEHLERPDIEAKFKKSSSNDEEPMGLVRVERQWVQITKAKDKDTTPYIDKDGILDQLGKLKYPFHFIDFETTTAAIPFHKGSQPYEGIAFQFSHHTMQADGSVSHTGQFLHAIPGVFPNFEFVRALKRELENDTGSIFRYASHENNYLNFIINQLDVSQEPDRNEIIAFLKSITTPSKKRNEKWVPERPMVDLLKWVKAFYYHPKMEGSNSIKAVLPTILSESKFLREKYSKPIYGKGCPIPSLNFTAHTWLTRDERGNVVDPYKQLPPIFEDTDSDTKRLLFHDEKLADGGAAMTAWARMQFTNMTDSERTSLSNALLKYCELDTLAMVMIIEYWKDETK